MKKRLIIIALALALLCAAIPAGINAFAAGNITRAEWVSQLVAAFDMTVENDDNMPDNYFSDISEDMPYYRDILLAVEFGVINIEAGEPFYPDEPATREFAAQTLNSCLLFQLGEGESYTFSESGSVTYPDDIQVAINRGWFKLSGNNFMPDQAVTTAEMTAMLSDAKAVPESEAIDENHQNTFEFAPGVIEIPQTANTSIAADNTVTITDYDPKIKAGDIFVVYTGDLPVALKATNVTADGNTTTIAAAKEGVDGAITSADAEGVIDVDLENIEAPEPVTYQVYNTVTAASEDFTVEAAGFDYDKNTNTLYATYDFKVGGSTAGTLSATLNNLKTDYKVNVFNGKYSASVSADAKLNATVEFDIASLAGIPKNITLAEVPIFGFGRIGLNAEIAIDGGISMTWEGKIKTGFSYKRGEGWNFKKDFKKKNFSFVAHIDLKIGLRLSAGVNLLEIAKGEIYATCGAKASYKYNDYGNGSPRVCETLKGYMYATVGYSIDIVLVDSKSDSIDIFNESNSPIRVVYHYEDGKLVSTCSRGEDLSYTTSPWSRYFNPYYGQGSYGDGGTAEPIIIWEYEVDDEGNATITKFRGNASAVAIPETIDGYTVTKIGTSAFEGNLAICTVYIPNSIVIIGGSAFNGCRNLSQVTLSKNLTELGWNAFNNCDSLREIEIPKSLTQGTAWGPFGKGLKTVTFEEGTTQVAAYLFYDASDLENVTLLDTMTTIEPYAFTNCTALIDPVIPNSVIKIGNNAFEGCLSFKNITIPDSVITIGGSAFNGCRNLSQVTLSKNLTELGWNAFNNCDSLHEIEIPKSLTQGTAWGPFGKGLKTVTFEEGTTQVAAYLFYDASDLENVTLLDTMTTIEPYAFTNCTSLKNIEIPDSVTKIKNDAFRNCTTLIDPMIPNSVIEIGGSAFEGCLSLTNITIPDPVTIINVNTFSGCISLEKVKLPEGLKAVNNNAFSKCSSLKEINIPENVTSIGNTAFNNCDALTSAVINGSGSIGNSAFYDCDALTSINIADGVTEIGREMCYGCDKLTDVKLGKYITNIPDSAFRLCQSLESVNIPRFCTTIAANAFAEDTKLTSAYIPPYVTKIENNSFSYPAKMTVYGKSGSYAEEYAKSRNIKFNSVDAPITSISFAESEVFADRSKTIVLPMNITPEFDTDTITFSSSDENVATVKENGVINTRNYGTTTITASTSGGKTAMCSLRVLSNGTIIKFEAEKNGDTANVHIETGIVPAGAIVYIAAYDRDGTLTSFTTADLANYTADTTILINNARKLKAFVWDPKTLEPLTQAKEINI